MMAWLAKTAIDTDSRVDRLQLRSMLPSPNRFFFSFSPHTLLGTTSAAAPSGSAVRSTFS